MSKELIAIPPLNQRQILISLGLGVGLWLAAALLLNALKDTGIYEGSGQILLYLAVIPGTAPFIWMIAKAAGVAKGQTALASALCVGAAILLDGLALAWAPGLYGGAGYVADAGPVILWGGGVAIMLGFGYDRLIL